MSSFSFVVVYVVVGCLTKTCCVNCILKWVASFESQESQLSKDI